MALTLNGTAIGDLPCVRGMALRYGGLQGDSLLIKVPADVGSDALPFAHGDVVDLDIDGARHFRGHCYAPGSEARGRGQYHTFEIRGGMHQLARVVYRQVVKSYASTDEETGEVTVEDSYSSKVMLFENAAGSLIGISAQLQAIVEYAAAHVGIAWGGGPSTSLPPNKTEARSLTCAAAVLRVLHWLPDCTCYTDYSDAAGTEPKIYFKRIGELSAASLAFSALGTRIAEAADRKAPGAVVEYLLVADSGSGQRTKVVVDKYPTDLDEDTEMADVPVFQIEGAAASSQPMIGRTLCESIPPPDDDGGYDEVEAKAWWKQHSAELAVIDDDDFAIDSHELEAPGDQEISNGHAEGIQSAPLEPTDYPRELIGGSLADWMPFKSARVDAKATLRWKGTVPVPAAKRAAFDALFGDGYQVTVNTSVTGTDAPAGDNDHKGLANFRGGEAAPSGLAALYHAALQAQPWQGDHEFLDTAHGATFGVGQSPTLKKLNLTGGQSDWSSMAAGIWGGDYDLFSMRWRIRFGPSRLLEPADLLKASEPAKKNKARHRLDEARAEAQIDTGEAAENATATPGAGHTGGGAGGKAANPAKVSHNPLPRWDGEAWEIVLDGRCIGNNGNNYHGEIETTWDGGESGRITLPGTGVDIAAQCELSAPEEGERVFIIDSCDIKTFPIGTVPEDDVDADGGTGYVLMYTVTGGSAIDDPPSIVKHLSGALMPVWIVPDPPGGSGTGSGGTGTGGSGTGEPTGTGAPTGSGSGSGSGSGPKDMIFEHRGQHYAIECAERPDGRVEDVVEVYVKAMPHGVCKSGEEPVDELFAAACDPGTIKTTSAMPRGGFGSATAEIRWRDGKPYVQASAAEALGTIVAVCVRIEGVKLGAGARGRFAKRTAEEARNNAAFYRAAHEGFEPLALYGATPAGEMVKVGSWTPEKEDNPTFPML